MDDGMGILQLSERDALGLLPIDRKYSAAPSRNKDSVSFVHSIQCQERKYAEY